jgi:TonB family protein
VDNESVPTAEQESSMIDAWKQCEGQMVDDRFLLRQFLGGSDHSVVFLTDIGERQPQRAAIKFVSAAGPRAGLQLTRWRLASQLSHPNLLQLFNAGSCRLNNMNLLYVVMEYAGEGLSQVVTQRALSADEMRDLLGPVVDGLSYLHAQGFVHAQLRPTNVLANDDQVKLSADGLCRIGEPLDDTQNLTLYDAPEAAAGGNLHPAADLWSLGATIVEALTQKLPFAESAEASGAEQTGAAASAIAGNAGSGGSGAVAGAGANVRPKVVIPETLPSPFLAIVTNCLQLEPRHRGTLAEISAKLRSAAARTASAASGAGAAESQMPSAVAAGAQNVAAVQSGAAATEMHASAGGAEMQSSAVATSTMRPSVDVVVGGDDADLAASVATPVLSPKTAPVAPRQNTRPDYSAAAAAAGKSARKYSPPNLSERTERSESKSFGFKEPPRYLAPAAIAVLVIAAIFVLPKLVSHRGDNSPKATSTATASAPAAASGGAMTAGAPKPAAKNSTPRSADSSSRGKSRQASRDANQVAAVPTQPSQNNLQSASQRDAVKSPDSGANSGSSPAIGAQPERPAMASPNSGGVSANRKPAGALASSGAVISQVLPDVSARARSTIHGTVHVAIKVHVDAAGAVTSTDVASSPSSFFAGLATQAARRWSFSAPNAGGGQSVPSEWLLRFEFTQAQTKVFPTQIRP